MFLFISMLLKKIPNKFGCIGRIMVNNLGTLRRIKLNIKVAGHRKENYKSS